MSADYKELIEFQKNIEKLANEREAFIKETASELVARLLRKVEKRTPVGKYDGNPYTCEGGMSHKGHKVKGRTGGNLRRSWTAETIRKEGNNYIIEVINPTEYASYVEYGHRTANHSGWVNGHFMMTISEKEVKQMAPKVLEAKLEKWLREHLDK